MGGKSGGRCDDSRNRCQAGVPDSKEKKGMNNEENEREKAKEREKEKKTPVKYVVTEGTRNSPASGNRNKSKKGRKQLRNSRGRCDRMIGGPGRRKRHGEEVMRKD